MGSERAYRDSWGWALGIAYIVAVASIWIAASYIVQTVVDEGVSPFLLTYICNSLFVVYIPIVEIARYLEDSVDSLSAKHQNKPYVSESDSENVNLLASIVPNRGPNIIISSHREASASGSETAIQDKGRILPPQADVFSSGNPFSGVDKQLDSKGRWLRTRVAKVSLLICPFWFFAQLTFNLSLKYTTVTSNTILSSSSSLFTFLVSVAFLGENFTWVKLVSVFLCMGGTVIVSLADVGVGVNAIASNPVLGDALTLISACLYAVYISLIRKNLPDEMKGEGHASMAQFLGYLGLFNLLIFLPVALGLEFTKLESFHKITWNQFSLIVGKMDHFWKYIDDRQAARKYTSSRDIDALERHCTEQIERILLLWNEDGDFRRQYIESNLKSTLRRFGTLDGRTIGLNEEAVVLPSRVPPPLSTRSIATPVKLQEEQLGSAREISRHEWQAKKMVRSKPSSKSTSIENTPAVVSVKEEIVEEVKLERNLEEEAQIRLEEERKRKEEEQKRKEEELVKEREAVELKEKIRMEQKAKAKEAEERKRRKSEKALARAEYKAQKAAELREQKRVKKEKKKDELPETTGSTEGENASVTDFSSHENSPEPERILKKSTRQSAVAPNKYKNRVQPVPLPLRNKGKRRSSMLVWTLCGAVAVGGLIFAGNYVSFAEINLLDFGF